MAQRFLVGVDLGTSATKTAVYDADGRLIAEASAAADLIHGAPGEVDQDQDDFLRTAALTIRKALADSGVAAGEIAAIGFSSQMAGIGAIDEDFLPTTRYDSWLDMRCERYVQSLARDHAEAVTAITGCPPTCAHAAKMLWWQHEDRRAYERIARFVTPAGYVAGRLARLRAEDAFIDHTFLHFTGVADSQAGTWSQVLCDRLGVDMARMPRILEPWTVIGEATGEIAEMFAIAPGTPVVAGAGDTAAAALGGGIVRSGMLLDVAGTASVLAGCTDHFVADSDNLTLLTMRSAVPGLWHPLAFIGGGGLALEWFGDLFATDAGRPAFDTLVAEALAVAPGADGLMFSPHFGGRICPADPHRRGSFQGLAWSHRRGHMFRAVLESIAYEYAGYLRILESLSPDTDRLEARVVGGGARSHGWNRIKADVLDVPYRKLPREDIGTLGVAIVAGHAVGLFEDIAATAARLSAPSPAEPVRPDPESARQYRGFIDRYHELQSVLDHL